MQTPLVLIACSFVIGLLLGHGFLFFPFTVAFAALLFLAAAVVPLRTGRVPLSLVVLTAGPALVGAAAYVLSAAWFPSDHYLRTHAFDREDHIVTGTVAAPLERHAERTAFIIAVHEINGVASSGRMRVSLRDQTPPVGYGDVLRIQGRIFEPGGYRNPGGFDYPAYLAQRGIHAMLSVKRSENIAVLMRGGGIFRMVQDRRERIRRSFLADLNGPPSAVIQAMVLGEKGGLTDDMRDRFMAAGVAHIIAISGTHLGLVAALCFGFLRALLLLIPERRYHLLTLHADPKKIAAWLTVLPVTFYAALAGGQMSTLRALVMILAALAALVLDRQHGLLQALSAAALALLLVSPQAIFDLSFQLSFLSVLAIGGVVAFWNELQVPDGGRLRALLNHAMLLLAISLAAGLATGPLVARSFNHVSLAGLLSNMLVVPFAGLIVVPLGLLSGVLSLFADGLPLAGLNQAAGTVFYSLVSFFSRLPGAEVHPPAPGLVWTAAYYLLLVSAAAWVRSVVLYRLRPLEHSGGVPRRYRAGVIAGGAALAALFALSLVPARDMRVTFLDVGQGDSALVELPSRRFVLIDGGGTYDNRFDIGRRVVAPFLRNRGVGKIDLLVLSHPHPDHIHGLFFVLRSFPVSEIWENGEEALLPALGEFRRLAIEKGIPLTTVSAGARGRIGDAALTVLHPPGGYAPGNRRAYAAENNRSLVVRVQAGGTTLLFTGDSERGAEQEMVRSGQNLACDVLKVPHHGSKSSSTAEFVSAARPAVAVASAGRTNRFGHPAEEVVARYEQAGTRFFRTDRDGAVIVIAGSDGVKVHGWADLMLQRITLGKRSGWWKQEKENWRRIFTRIATRGL